MVPKILPFYMVHDNITLECVSEGTPTPVVFWMWQECSSAKCSFDEAGWQNITMCPNIYEIKDYECNSTISVEAEVSGFFQCTGYNKLGNHSKHERFVATGKQIIDTLLSSSYVLFKHLADY